MKSSECSGSRPVVPAGRECGGRSFPVQRLGAELSHPFVRACLEEAGPAARVKAGHMLRARGIRISTIVSAWPVAPHGQSSFWSSFPGHRSQMA
jgi:hypothetical protein